jgi:hypothetical protein
MLLASRACSRHRGTAHEKPALLAREGCQIPAVIFSVGRHTNWTHRRATRRKPTIGHIPFLEVMPARVERVMGSVLNPAVLDVFVHA